jgi:hypothetical protein
MPRSLFPAFVVFVLVAVGWHGYASVLNAREAAPAIFQATAEYRRIPAVANSIPMKQFSRAKW